MQEIFYQIDTRKFPKERVNRYKAALRKHYDCPVWTTQDERCIPIEKMRSSHLVNTVNHLVKLLHRGIERKDSQEVKTRWMWIDALATSAKRTNRLNLVGYVHGHARINYMTYRDPLYMDEFRDEILYDVGDF